MIIVTGHLTVAPADRDSYLDSCRTVVAQARSTPGCVDYALSPDLLESDRINVLEVWESRGALDAFRGSGPDDEYADRIVAFAVTEYECG